MPIAAFWCLIKMHPLCHLPKLQRLPPLILSDPKDLNETEKEKYIQDLSKDERHRWM